MLACTASRGRSATRRPPFALCSARLRLSRLPLPRCLLRLPRCRCIPQLLQTIQAHAEAVEQLLIVPETGFLVTCSSRCIRVWQYGEQRLLKEWAHPDAIRSLGLLRKVRKVACGTEQHRIVLFPLDEVRKPRAQRRGMARANPALPRASSPARATGCHCLPACLPHALRRLLRRQSAHGCSHRTHAALRPTTTAQHRPTTMAARTRLRVRVVRWSCRLTVLTAAQSA